MSNAAGQTFNPKLVNPATGPFIPGPDFVSLADRAALYMLLVSTFFVPSDLRIDGAKSLVHLFGYCAVLLGLFVILIRRSWTPPALGFVIATGFILWSTCTLTWTLYPAEGTFKVLQYWRGLPLAWLFTQYAWSNRARNQLYDTYVAGCWLGFFGLLHSFIAGSAYTSDGTEFEGRYSFGTDPNFLALALVIGIPFACHRAATAESRWLRRLSFWYVPAAVAAVAFTGSRGGMLALVAAACGYAVWSSGRTRLWIIAGIATLLLLVFVAPFLPARFQSIPQELENGSLSGRRDLWTEGIAVVEQYPIAGLGAGEADGLLQIAAHNTPLEILMAGGMISFLLFYTPFALALARIARKLSTEHKALLMACTAWFVGTMSLSWDENTISWMLLAILWSVPAVTRRAEVAAPAAHDFSTAVVGHRYPA